MILFQNPGTLPVEAYSIMGINAKDSDNPIGHFGTGLKYAMAIACREGWRMSINTGDGVWQHVRSQSFSFRNKDFETIYLGDHQLPFTTEYGKSWEPWQAFRELLSNALDESGEAVWSSSQPEPLPNHVQIVLSGPSIKDLWDRREEYFIPSDASPAFTIDEFEFYPNRSGSPIYLRGINVGRQESDQFSARYKINITQTQGYPISEDRALRSMSSFHDKLRRTLWTSDEVPEHIYAEYFIRQHDNPSVENLVGYNIPSWMAPNRDRVSDKFWDWAVAQYDAHANLSGPIYALVASTRRPKNDYVASADHKKTLERAKAVLSLQGIVAPSDHTIEIAQMQSYLGTYDANHKIITISTTAFDQGLHRVVSTLYEEILHSQGVDDFSRQFQDILLDKLSGFLINSYYSNLENKLEGSSNAH